MRRRVVPLFERLWKLHTPNNKQWLKSFRVTRFEQSIHGICSSTKTKIITVQSAGQ